MIRILSINSGMLFLYKARQFFYFNLLNFSSSPKITKKYDHIEFPSHEEYLDDQYLNNSQDSQEKESNSEEDSTEIEDETSYQKYKRLMNCEIPQEEKISEREKIEYEDKVINYLNSIHDPKGIFKTTKDIIHRYRTDRSFDFGKNHLNKIREEEFKDYDNYVKSKVKLEEEKPYKYHTNEENANDFLAKFKTDELEEFASECSGDEEVLQKIDAIRKQEDITFEDMTFHKEGRLSPQCKDQIYAEYMAGWTVKDLSLKYGIIPERVKAVAYSRNVFWTQIFPREGFKRIACAMEIEYRLHKEVPYCDYGLDLQMLAERQNSLIIGDIKRSQADKNPSEKDKKEIENFYSNQKPLQRVNFEFYKIIGVGPKSYIVRNRKVKNGKGSIRVSEEFKRTCFLGDYMPQRLNKKIKDKLQFGPRKATKKYRMY